MKTSPHSLPAWKGIDLLTRRVLRNPRNVVGLPLRSPTSPSSAGRTALEPAGTDKIDSKSSSPENICNGKTRHYVSHSKLKD